MSAEFLQKIVDFLRGKPAEAQIGGRQEFWKAAAVLRHAPEIETLVLGSSHAQCGFDVKAKEFNLGLPSQDLYYSFSLAEKLLPKMPNLRRVCLFYSVFSPGLELERTGNRARCFHYECLFGIPWKTPACRDGAKKCRKWIARRCEKMRRRETVPPEYCGENVLEYHEFLPQIPEEVAATASGHLKNNMRGNHQTVFVERLQRLLAERGCRLAVVLSPGRADYRALLPDARSLYPELFELRRRLDFELFDTFDFPALADSDFRDSDHLNASGAAKLADFLRSEWAR